MASNCRGNSPPRALFEPKYLKSGKNNRSLANFPKGGCMTQLSIRVLSRRLIRASFEPKISKIGQETAELWPIYQREVA